MLVATNCIEEGVDVPSCNLVIRYDTNFNLTKIVQSRGRARRAEGAKFLLLMRKDAREKFELIKKEACFVQVTSELW